MKKSTNQILARLLILGLILIGSLLLTACNEEAAAQTTVTLPDADLPAGREALREYGCMSCHTIPGLRGATGKAGPPLTRWSERRYIAGTLPNTPENLILWIMNPQAVEEGTAMPNLNVSELEARNIAAYLYSLD